MYVDLLKDVHEKSVDLWQESQDENDWEEKDKGVGAVPGQLQVSSRREGRLVEFDGVLVVGIAQMAHQQAKSAAQDKIDCP